MHTIYGKRNHLTLFIVVSFFSIFTLTEVHAQKKGKKSEKYIYLKKDALTNGYKITEENGEIFLDAADVTDPKTKKLIEGLKRLLYRCSQSGPEIPVPVTFSNGRVNRVKIACTVLYEPKILLPDEPIPGQQ